MRYPCSLAQLLEEVVDKKKPCVGLMDDHYSVESYGGAFGSLVRAAHRNGRPDGEGGIGHFPAFRGTATGVSAILHVVGDGLMFRSGGCTGIARSGDFPPRCSACSAYNAKTFAPKMEDAASVEYEPTTNNTLLNTVQKVNESIVSVAQGTGH